MRRPDPCNMPADCVFIEKLETRRVMSSPVGASDGIPPTVISSVFEWDARQAVTFNFSEPINPATVSTTDLSTLNLDTAGTPVAVSVAMNAGNTAATWTFNANGAVIADGHYKFTLAAGGVSDVSGMGLSPAYTLVFGSINYFAGDSNRDHRVNTPDFNTLAGNFGLPGKTFSQGNFDYAGNVDSVDFGIFTRNYGKILPLPAPLPSGGASVGSVFGGAKIGGSGENIDLLMP